MCACVFNIIFACRNEKDAQLIICNHVSKVFIFNFNVSVFFLFVCVAQPLNHRFGMSIFYILLCPIVHRYVDDDDVMCVYILGARFG